MNALPPVTGSPWPPDDRIELSILLRRGSPPGSLLSMDERGRTPIGRRTFRSREEFALAHSAREEDIAAVRRFADRTRLSIERVEPARRVVTVSGTAARLSVAFGVRLRRRGRGRFAYRETDAPPEIPPELTGIARGVFGLDTRPVLRPHFRRNAKPNAVTGYAIPTVGTAYGFPSNMNGSGVTIGLLEFGGGYSDADLSQYFSSIGVPIPTVTAVGVGGGSNAPTGNPNGPDAEVELDIEMAGALAPGAEIVVYFAPNHARGFVDALTTAIHDAIHHPSIVSISWGGAEPSWTPPGLTALEDAADDGAEMGVTVLAASGDQGASDGEPGGARAVDFPASSPYVVGCGGTRLTLSGSTIVSEVVWNDLAEGVGATGGGVSEDFPRPSYQADANVPLAPSGFAGRGVPDVAADADPDTGYSIVVDGASTVIGGTSAAAPLWAALFARCIQALGKPIGYVNPLLYSPPFSSGFREITRGNNDGYSAGPGWNPCTGLGSPEGSKLLGDLRS